MLSFHPQPPLSKLNRRPRQGNDPDWQRLKETIQSLYANNDLKCVMQMMDESHGFKASEKLYKTKIRDWGFDTKRIKACEYKAILKKKRKREGCDPGRPTKFQLRGEIVPDSKIERWENRMLKQGTINADDTFSDVGTPPGLTFRTPSPLNAGSSPILEVSALFSKPAKSNTKFDSIDGLITIDNANRSKQTVRATAADITPPLPAPNVELSISSELSGVLPVHSTTTHTNTGFTFAPVTSVHNVAFEESHDIDRHMVADDVPDAKSNKTMATPVIPNLESSKTELQSIADMLKDIEIEQTERLRHLGSELDEISNLSLHQFHSFKDVLRNISELQEQISDLKQIQDPKSLYQGLHSSQPSTEEQSSIIPEEQAFPAERLHHVVVRLSELIEQQVGTRETEESQTIFEDLSCLLDAPRDPLNIPDDLFMGIEPSGQAQSVIDGLQSLYDSSSRRLKAARAGSMSSHKQREEAENAIDEEEEEHQWILEKVQEMLAVSRHLIINHPPASKPRSSEIQYVQKTRSKRYQLRHGVMHVTTRIRNLRPRGEKSSQEDTVEGLHLTEYDATVQFMPTEPELKARLCARFCQVVGLGETHTLIPTLSTCMIVPPGSLIFHYAVTGKLDRMKELIQAGKASLRDCDPDGRSLLTYACYAEQPKICAYLLQEGADFDTIEPTFEVPGQRIPPLGQFSRPLYKIPVRWPHESPSQILCKNLLISAGADPLAKEEGEGNSPLEVSLQDDAAESICRFLDSGRILLDVNQVMDNGRTLLLQHAFSYDGSNPEVIPMLLQRGADVHARDDDGNSCLHLHIQSLLRVSTETSRGSIALVHLLRAGADPHAVNREGQSVALLAHTTTADDDDLELGSYRGDVWDTALQICGHNLTSFSEWKTRGHEFTRRYTEYHHQALKSGIRWDETHHDYWVFQASIYDLDDINERVSVYEESTLYASEDEDMYEASDENVDVPRDVSLVSSIERMDID